MYIMETRRKPVKGQYVVSTKTESCSSEQLGRADDFLIDPIVELPGAYLAKAKDPGASEGVLRDELRVLMGENCSIQNVLEDDDGHIFLPTGKINLTVSEALPKSELRALIERRRLKLVNQSKWMPELVTVAADDLGIDIDQIVQELKRDPAVETAEPDVLAKFTRESPAKTF